MARRGLRGRWPLPLAAVLPLAVLTACSGGPPQACSLVMLESSVAVDLSGLDVDLRSVDAALCVANDCGATRPWTEGSPTGGIISRIGPDIPSGDDVDVRVVLTDPGTGIELYRGSGAVPVDTVEPNGPGCGETRTLPTVIADPDGTLRS
jgi:hypothetical protein